MSRLNELDAPGTIDFERLYRIVDVLDGDRARARRDAGAGRDQLGAAQAGRRHGRSSARATKRNCATTSPRPTWRLTAEEMARLDEVSALPEPYPQWHQHKFGIERNPRLPALRAIQQP